MRELLPELERALTERREAALCRLVETRGSTPQKAGAAMLVFPDGSQQGTLGGGCVEAEVKRRALAVMQQGGCELASFQLDSDYGWDDGLICGGRMKVLLAALSQASFAVYLRGLLEVAASGRGVTEAIVYDLASSRLAAPQAVLFSREGNPLAHWLGAAEALTNEPAAVVQQLHRGLRPVDTRPRPYASGGVAYLPLLGRRRLIIAGGGHVGQAVAALAADLEFDVWVVDDREDYVTAERFPRAEMRLAGPLGDVLPKLAIDCDTYCLVVTRGHNHDQEALYRLVGRGACYVGMIGSRRKVRMILDNLAAEGVSREVLSAVYAPVGLDLGSQTVAEIAVSICSQLIAHRNLGDVAARARSRWGEATV